MHVRLATVLVAAIAALTAAPALAVAEPTPPATDSAVVEAVEAALMGARTATTATQRSACLEAQAAIIAQERVAGSTEPVDHAAIRSACKVLQVLVVSTRSAEEADAIATALTERDAIAATASNAYASRFGAAAYRADADAPAVAVLLVAQPRRTAVFVGADTTSVGKAFVAARKIKPAVKHAACLHTAARAIAKERVASAGGSTVTQKQLDAIEKKCKMRVVGYSALASKAGSKDLVAKSAKLKNVRVYAGRRTPVSYGAAVYVDTLSGTKHVAFLAGQPR